MIEEPIADELTDKLAGTGCPIIVTKEDIRRYYYLHPEQVDVALAETSMHFKDRRIEDYIEAWFRFKFQSPCK